MSAPITINAPASDPTALHNPGPHMESDIGSLDTITSILGRLRMLAGGAGSPAGAAIIEMFGDGEFNEYPSINMTGPAAVPPDANQPGSTVLVRSEMAGAQLDLYPADVGAEFWVQAYTGDGVTGYPYAYELLTAVGAGKREIVMDASSPADPFQITTYGLGKKLVQILSMLAGGSTAGRMYRRETLTDDAGASDQTFQDLIGVGGGAYFYDLLIDLLNAVPSTTLTVRSPNGDNVFGVTLADTGDPEIVVQGAGADQTKLLPGVVVVRNLAAGPGATATYTKLFTVVNGGGKQELYAQFASGAPQLIATEP